MQGRRDPCCDRRRTDGGLREREENYTDSEGKEKKRDVIKKSYKTLRVEISTVIDARSIYLSKGATKIGSEMSEGFLDALMYYSPAK